MDLDFDAATQSFELSVSERATLFDSDSSDDEMTDNKKSAYILTAFVILPAIMCH